MPKKRALKKAPRKKADKPVGDATFQRAKDVLSRRNVDGTVAIMRLADDQHFFTIEGVAAEVWLMIDGQASINQIKETIMRKHKPSEARLDRNLSKLIKGLLKEKLIRA
ncbi:MAG: PqqD family protein [Deltaproteobacteria bacterium]|nr:PqqD family protein [Deltaproteobacteria bacterium]